MSITPGNLSMLLALASSVAPGTWAILAGVLGAFVGYFGKAILKKYDRTTRSKHSRSPRKISGVDSSSGTSNSRSRKKSAGSSRD